MTFTGHKALLYRQFMKDLFEQIQNSNHHLLLNGNKGEGKTCTLLQMASQFRLLDNWIVVYSPNPLRWTNGNFPYKYNEETHLYDQEDASKQLLNVILSFNREKLTSLESISNMIQVGTSDKQQAPQILDQVLQELLSNKRCYIIL